MVLPPFKLLKTFVEVISLLVVTLLWLQVAKQVLQCVVIVVVIVLEDVFDGYGKGRDKVCCRHLSPFPFLLLLIYDYR